ncbi:MAG TPA: AbrB family transcriptional regulator [Xanthobacteraceae bacterium]|nr:AbrB family transcriptional regulator [Xanthobacteraceae bacterium]
MSSSASPYRLRHVAETALVAAAGGLTLGLAKFPAGFLSGAILFVAVASLAGRPMTVPGSVARVFFVLLGTSIGAVVTPQTLAGIGSYPVSIISVTLAMVCITGASVTYLRRVHGWDTQTAVLAAIPGALSQVVAVGADQNADLRAIAIVQTLRVAILAIGVPVGMSLLGLVSGPAQLPAQPDLSIRSLVELATLLSASTAVAIAIYRLGFPGGLIFGAMLTSAFLHGSGFVHVSLPWWVVDGSMIALGAFSGSRFAGTDIWLLLRFSGAALGCFAIGMAVTALCAVAVTAVLPVRLSDAVIAYAPGSIDAMMILALALHLDPVFVGAHHLARVFVISVSLPFLARWTAPAEAKAAEPAFAPHKRRGTFQD